MARFYPLYVRRSDGKSETSGKGKRKERNAPTDEQLDQRPDKNGVSDFYREVADDETKSLDWRRKLGGMLARELDWKDPSGQDTGCILVAFPEHYRLYEHVKKTEKDGKTEVKSKTHAGGGNDRQDAYLYGHPAGRRKRFRSPADFFPHLLWLCTDESGDPDNCACKICLPEDLESTVPGSKAKPERPVKPDADTKPLLNQTGTPVSGPSSTPNAAVQQVSSSVPPSAPANVPPNVPPTRPPSTPRTPLASPLPPCKTDDQRADRQYGSFIYRPGELVWFRRGPAWGLGVVLRRWFVSAGSPPHYIVQPLSFPGAHPQAVTISSHLDMRPWLAWSVPQFTNDGLNNPTDPPRFETADWQGMQQKRYGSGDMEVDASIMAAKSIDSTYTPFGLHDTTQPEPGVEEKHYDGVFLGAEKIWVGDPVRLHIGPGTDIMVVHAVVERTRTLAVGQQRIQQSCYLIGDVYTLSTVNHTNPNIPTPAAASSNLQLPIRLTEDLADRNAKSVPARRVASYWKLVAAQYRLDINDVKGRWYEASLLLPILNQPQYDEAARKGEVAEASLLLNSRGDCQNSNRPPNLPKLPKMNVRKETRREALGQAVPPHIDITDGLAPPMPPNMDPAGTRSDDVMEIDARFHRADAAHHDPPGGQHDGGLDEFIMDDGMGEDPHSFEQAYGHQASHGRPMVPLNK